MEPIRWFEDITLDDAGVVGGKGANLGELTAGGLPVPPGFVVTGPAYLDALDRAGARHAVARGESGERCRPISAVQASRNGLSNALVLPEIVPDTALRADWRHGKRVADVIAVCAQSAGEFLATLRYRRIALRVGHYNVDQGAGRQLRR